MNIPASLCIRCKGSRYLCGYKPCPLMPRIDLAPKIEKTLGKDFFGPSYSVFVGRSGYPDVNLGPLAAIENRTNIDNPASWFGMGYSRVIELRSLLLRSKQPVNVRSKGRFVEETQEIAMADGQTDVEMLFRSKPLYRVSFSDMVQPMGPVAGLERMKITENTRIPAFVERIVSDEMKAQQAGFELYRKGQDVYKITTILSSGVLGRQGRRKLVPTRWSI
ncbi:MAG: hypothetical protein HY518_05220, partial [Candidatus Aenigmarchaeota archaeon]|nr:hypothetical protein [Candidatus Aenigmarchaeota archaeon]